MYNGFADRIVQQIYRGAHSQGSWQPALIAIGELLRASSTSLRISCGGMVPREFLTSVGPKVQPDVVRQWEADRKFTPAMPVLGGTKITSWRRDDPGNPIVDDLTRYDVAVTLSHCFDIDGTTKHTLYITRAEGEDAFSADEIALIESIGGHFGEAVRLRRDAVHGRITSTFQSQALDRLGVAGLLIDPFGTVLTLNKTAEDMLAVQDCLKLRHNRLSAVDRSGDRELQQSIARLLDTDSDQPRTAAMSLERLSGKRPMGVVISSAEAISLMSNRPERCVLIFARDSEATLALEPEVVQELFSFTPAEANLAIGLASGLCLEDIEGTLNIRHNTARAHLRSIFSKAEVNRQAELVHLIASSVVPLGRKRAEIH